MSLKLFNIFNLFSIYYVTLSKDELYTSDLLLVCEVLELSPILQLTTEVNLVYLPSISKERKEETALQLDLGKAADECLALHNVGEQGYCQCSPLCFMDRRARNFNELKTSLQVYGFNFMIDYLIVILQSCFFVRVCAVNYSHHIFLESMSLSLSNFSKYRNHLMLIRSIIRSQNPVRYQETFKSRVLIVMHNNIPAMLVKCELDVLVCKLGALRIDGINNLLQIYVYTFLQVNQIRVYLG